MRWCGVRIRLITAMLVTVLERQLAPAASLYSIINESASATRTITAANPNVTNTTIIAIAIGIGIHVSGDPRGVGQLRQPRIVAEMACVAAGPWAFEVGGG